MSSKAIVDRCRLELLHYDVLARILDSVESKRDLTQLSSTCRWLRTLCKPLMFTHFLRYVTEPLQSRNKLLPAFVWPYVREFTLVDLCPDRVAGAVYAKDSFQCGVLDSPKLLRVLCKSSNLTSLSLVMRNIDTVHGVSWIILRTVLALPALREFSVIGLLLSPSTPPSDLDPSNIAPLRLFRYEPHISRKHPPFRFEVDTLDVILTTYHHTLEVLSLPSEPARIEDLASRDWPRLRELRIRGEQWSTPGHPYTSLFSKMRGLRTLVLQLTVAEGVEPRLFCNPRDVVSFPWPELEQLTLSHPSARDAVYSHLPERMRVLSMSCYPHLAERPWLHATIREFDCPVPTSSEMLRILRQCRTYELEELHLEYHADDCEEELLQYVAATFPMIQTLQIYRYKSQGKVDFMEGNLIDLLVPLARLNTLRCSLDLETTPTPSFTIPTRGWGVWGFDMLELDSYAASLQHVAEQLARHLCPSLTSIGLWSPRQGNGRRPVWYEFLVARVGRVGDPVVTGGKTVSYTDFLGLQSY